VIGFDRGATTVAIRDLRTQEQREFVPAMMGGFLLRGWSPDGRYLMTGGKDTAGREGIFAIDTNNGRVTLLIAGKSMVRPDWLPDGRLLYLNPSTGALTARNVETGADEIVENLRAEGLDIIGGLHGRGFKISPDGQTLALTAATRGSNGSTRTLAVKPLGHGGTVRELVRATESDLIMFQDWTPDGAAVLFTRWIADKPGSNYALWRVSVHGGDPQPLGLSMPSVRDVSVHPDGAKITFTSGYPKHELWVMENFLANK
jgi:Tol biopolymer transport system component